jgi:hypothetical protein
VDERGPSLVGFLQNLNEGLAQPQAMDVSDKFTALGEKGDNGSHRENKQAGSLFYVYIAPKI